MVIAATLVRGEFIVMLLKDATTIVGSMVDGNVYERAGIGQYYGRQDEFFSTDECVLNGARIETVTII